MVIVIMIFSAFANNFDYSSVDPEPLVGLEENMTDEQFHDWWVQWNMDEEEMEAKKADILWSYLSNMIFMYLMMAGTIKGADSFLHQKLNL